MTHFTSAPPGHRKAIVLFCDGYYLPFAAWTASGLLTHGAGKTCDIVILSPDVAGLEKVAALVPDARAIEIPDSFKPFGFSDVPEDFPNRSFLNLFAPHFLSNEYDRLILCDVDYDIRSPDMPRLFDLEMKSYPLAAMRDIIGIHPTYAQANYERYYAPADLPVTTPYLNGGFQVIDVKAYLAENIAERALASTLKRGGPKYLGDQRALNAVLRGDWMELSPNCNWAAIWPKQRAWHGMYLTELLNPCGVHLLGAAKPWSVKRPRRINPALAERMRSFFAGTSWDGIIPRQDLSESAEHLETLKQLAPHPAQIMPRHVYAYMRRDFEDIAQGLAPSLNRTSLFDKLENQD